MNNFYRVVKGSEKIPVHGSHTAAQDGLGVETKGVGRLES